MKIRIAPHGSPATGGWRHTSADIGVGRQSRDSLKSKFAEVVCGTDLDAGAVGIVGVVDRRGVGAVEHASAGGRVCVVGRWARSHA